MKAARDHLEPCSSAPKGEGIVRSWTFLGTRCSWALEVQGTSMANDTNESTEWKNLFVMLGKRLTDPLGRPAYVFFFVVSLLIGAMGIWVALVEAWFTLEPGQRQSDVWENPSVFISMVTFFAGLGLLSCLQVIVVEDRQKNLRALLCLVLIALVAMTVVAALLQTRDSPWTYCTVSAIAILAVIVWWVANADDQKFVQENPVDSLGGEPDAEAAGDTTGFAV